MVQVVTDFLLHTDRYRFDLGACKVDNGYAQFDTSQDASYYGNWVNPFSFKLVCYCEGDLTVQICDDQDEFVSKVRGMVEWNGEGFKGIDPGFCGQLKGRFEDLGLGDLLH